jgi:hypothetical protein
MKKIITSSLIIAMAMGLIISCKKSEINGDSRNLVSGSYITLDSTITTNLDFSKATATVGIIITSKGSPVASVDIYLAKNADDARDTTEWVHIRNVPYTDGVTLTVSTTELANALAPDTIAPGTQYTLQNVVNTTDGRRFSVINTPDTYNSFPGYNMAITWAATATCPYFEAQSVGNYKVVTDSWADFTDPVDVIAVSAGSAANTVSFLGYPSPEAGGTNRKPWVLVIDPASGAATMKKQDVGEYPGAGMSYAIVKGYVFSCTGVITLNVTISYAGTPYPAKLILKKQ